MNCVKVFEQLQTTNSVVTKEKILRANINNAQLQNLLYFNLDPYFLTYIKHLDSYTQSRPPWSMDNTSYTNFEKLIYKLNDRTLIGNSAKEEVKRFLAHNNPDEAQWYRKILLKESIGVGASTVNKVWPNLVSEFKLLLAPNSIPDLTQLKYPCLVQPKLDGWRSIYIDGSLFTRGGLRTANRNLERYFNRLEVVENYILDGELYLHGTSFQSLSKILSAEDAIIPNRLKYVVFDCIPKKDWDNKQCNIPYNERLKLLRQILNDKVADYKKVIDIASDEVESPIEVKELYSKYLKKGYEGVMLRHKEGLYQWKRTTLKSGEIAKLKPFKSIDLKIKSIYDGEGEFQGIAGGVTVEYNNLEVKVGSGFSIKTREDLKNNPQNYIGKVIEVKYLEETEDKSLRHPIFKRFRPDKD